MELFCELLMGLRLRQASKGRRGFEGATRADGSAELGMVPKDDAGRGRAANLKGRIMVATASSASQLARMRTIAPRINFSFMAISRKSNPCSGPRFSRFLPMWGALATLVPKQKS